MPQYSWAVIGAGPAGIAAVGRLLDSGVDGAELAWIDPEFAAGDLGGKWRAVSGNTRVELFLDYLNASPAFRFPEAPRFELHGVNPKQTCPLGMVADPLVWITGQLFNRVHPYRTLATELVLHDRQWVISAGQGTITANNVILAIGAEPRTLSYPNLTEIPLETVLDPDKLGKLDLEGSTVAVFGGSHSAMVALPNLLKTSVLKIINFYRKPLKYAVYLDDWILHDDTGLKGKAADWARENIDGRWPERLQRCPSNDVLAFERALQQCDRVVYAVGFERRQLPVTPQWGHLDYDATNGILAPGLFGMGIAFPAYRLDPLGSGQYQVGLAKFVQELDDVLPLWLNYGT